MALQLSGTIFRLQNSSGISTKFLNYVISREVSCRYFSGRTDNSANRVYKGQLNDRLRHVKMFSLGSSLLGLCFQPVILMRLWEGSHSVLAVVSVSSFASFFIIGTPVLLQFLARRYITQLTFEPMNKEFEMTTLTLFNAEQKLKFKAGDVSVPDIPGPLTSFCVKGRPVMLDFNEFNDPSVYKHLMGYDKPLDLRLKQT